MNRATLVGIIITVALCGLVSWPSLEPAWAELIPILKPIPENLPVGLKETLSTEREELENDYEKFKKAGDKFSGKPKKQQSDTEYEELKAWRARHIKAVKAFNHKVTVAAAGQRVKPAAKKADQAIAKWSGNWNEKEKEKKLIRNIVRKFKDKELRDWIAANMEFKRSKPDGVSPISASGSALKIKDDFFLKTPGEQVNLLAFEAGKVFWNIVKGEQTLMNWWFSYDNKYHSVIAKMKRAKYGDRGEDLSKVSDPLFEHYSGFGYVFRAVVLPLDEPKELSELQEWNNAVNEFKVQIKKVLPEKQ